jgi:hypothetical protein
MLEKDKTDILHRIQQLIHEKVRYAPLMEFAIIARLKGK